MENRSSIIKNISEKVDSLVLERDRLYFDNVKLQDERERLIEERGKYVNKIAELRNEVRALKLACDMTSIGEKDRAKRRINAILKEVDTCIGLINKR